MFLKDLSSLSLSPPPPPPPLPPSLPPSRPGPDWYLVRVEMTVSDVNDNVPEWSMVPVPYLAVVSPDALPGSLVYQLIARDDDGGDNGEVEFFLSDGKELRGFTAKVAPNRGKNANTK